MSSNNTIVEVPYTPVQASGAMSNAPRFGHSDDISMLFSNENGASQGYIKGLIFAGGFILAIFLTWSLILLIFKCVGPRQLGFLSGARFKEPSYQEAGKYRRPSRVRLVVLVAVIIFIVFTVLLVVKGITNIQDTFTTVSHSNQDVATLLHDAKGITDSLQSIGDSSIAARDELVTYLGNFCPNNANLLQQTGFDLDAMAQTAIDLLNQLGDFINTNLNEVQNGIEASLQTTSSIDNIITKYDIHDWQSLIIIIPYIIVPSVLLVGLMLAAYNVSFPWFTCTITWFFIPLFALMVSFAYIASSVLISASAMNADFCTGGTDQTPDETIKAILKTQGFDENDIVSKAILFYISQCQTTNPWLFVDEYVNQITSANANMAVLNTTISSISVEQLSFFCGTDFSAIQLLLITMLTNLSLLKQNADATLDLLSCDRIVPIYTSTVYDGSCKYSITGLTWSFSSFLVIAFVGMLMLTFRSAFYEVDEESERSNSPSQDERYLDENDPFTYPWKGDTATFEEYSLKDRSKY